MSKTAKLVISTVTAVAAALGAALGMHFGYSRKTAPGKTYRIRTENDALRVGVISDLQLPDNTDKTTHQYQSFEKTLTMLKEKGMDVLVIGGDFTDVGTKKAWTAFKEIYDRVMGDDKQPVKVFIMGNHDYWLPAFADCGEIPTPAKQQRRFTKYTGELPYSHKIINGYHFIGWSSSDGTYDQSYRNKTRIRAELDKAVLDDPTKPIFVITHLNPMDTAYGSDAWGNADIHDVLQDYPQVISLSGHSHYTVADERSVWQGSYTAMSTQSLDYIELEAGKFNGSVPVDAYGNRIAESTPACLYMLVSADRIEVQRLEANTGTPLKDPWVISAPFGKNFTYTDDRKAQNAAPTLPGDLHLTVQNITDVNGKGQKMLSFAAGTDDDFVHSYTLQFLDENEQPIAFDECAYDGTVKRYDKDGTALSPDSKDYKNGSTKSIDAVSYFSDFVLGSARMSSTVELRIPATVPDSARYVSIKAIDSWSAESAAVVVPLEVVK